MAATPDEFVSWALGPERTIEEAFCAEILIDQGLVQWKSNNKIDDPDRYNFEVKREYHRRRRLNPAHRRVWSDVEVTRAAEFIPGFTKVDHWTHGEDRPLRDLSALRFCPGLLHLQVAPTELEHLDDLRYLPNLEHLWLQDEILEDLSALACCPQLKTVHLWLDFPWCDLRALAKLPQLEQLTLHGSLPMLEGVGPLLRVTKVLFNGWGNGRAPIRDAHSLPDMPALREAQISPIARLTGFGKYAALEEFTVEGPFKDLSSLADLPAANKLTLGGQHYHDLTPIARMPRLAVLRIAREFPLDYTPLLDSASLRELQRCNDEPFTPEQAGINAALGGWENEFLLTESRSLPEPIYRFIYYLPNPPAGFESPVGRREQPLPKPAQEAEGKWLAARLGKALDRKFGPDWGETYSADHDAHRCKVDVRVHSLEIADQLPEVVQFLREQLTALRNRWVIDLNLDLKAQWQKDPEAWKDPIQEDLEERISEAKSYAERRRDYLAFLERLQRYKLRQEQGQEPPPGEFAVPPPNETEPVDSDLLEPEPETAHGDSWEAEDHPRWHDYYMTIEVCEEGVWVPVGFRRKAARILVHAIEKFPGWTHEDEKEED